METSWKKNCGLSWSTGDLFFFGKGGFGPDSGSLERRRTGRGGSRDRQNSRPREGEIKTEWRKETKTDRLIRIPIDGETEIDWGRDQGRKTEKDRETDKKTPRPTERLGETDIETERGERSRPKAGEPETKRDTERPRPRQTDTETNRDKERQSWRPTEPEKEGEIKTGNGERPRSRDRGREAETGRQRDTERQRERENRPSEISYWSVV